MTAVLDIGGPGVVIRRAEEVTCDLLRQILVDAGRIACDDQVTTFTWEPVGTGQMADTVRFTLDYAGASPGPRSVIMKFASDDEQSRATGKAMRAYEIEVSFYAMVSSLVDTCIAAPLFVAYDPDEAWFTLVLDDVVGGTQGDQIDGCTPETAARVLREMGGLHAPCWGSPELAAMGWLNRSRPSSNDLTTSVVQGVFPGFVERYGDRLAVEHLALMEAFLPHLRAWLDPTGAPATAVHGDFRLDNLLFVKGQDRPVVVDFQTMGWRCGAHDVAYFLGGCLTVEDRRAHETDLLDQYHADLLRRGVTDFSRDQLTEQYRRESFGGVVMAIGASMLVKRTSRGDDMFVTSASRHAQHALDLDALETIQGGSP